MTPFRRAFTSYFYGPVRRERVTLLVWTFALVFAFDVWMNMLEHGWRYGADGFNVTHIEWLTKLHPVPTSELYVVLVGTASLLCFIVALGGFGRVALGCAGAAFTYSWLMSMLDSYQHHYFLSLVFACGLGMPLQSFGGDQEAERTPTSSGEHETEPLPDQGDDALEEETPDSEPEEAESPHSRDESEQDGEAAPDLDASSNVWIEAWGYPLLCTTLTLVYGFAAYAKAEPSWRTGRILSQVLGEERRWMLEMWQALGGAREPFWRVMGLAVVVTQAFLAIVYALAPLYDRRDGMGWIVLRTAGLCVALGLHTSIELLNFDIQWFSYYMIVIAIVMIGPITPLRWLERGLARLRDALEGPPRQWFATREEWVIVLGLGAALVAGLVIVQVGLPGTGWLAVGMGLIVATTAFTSSATSEPRTALRVIVAGGLASVCMWGTVAYDHTRFDFYRYAGGDLKRRLPGTEDADQRRRMIEQALDYYRRAERYAPADESRRDDIRELRRRLDSLDPP